MTGYIVNIEALTIANTYYRQVIYTVQNTQLVLMCLQPTEEIGVETHESEDQLLRVEEGEAKVILNGEEHLITHGDAILVPAGTTHNVLNTSPEKKLKLYTVYSPPHHRKGALHKTKEDSEKDPA